MGKLTVRKIEAKGPGIHGDGDTLFLRVRKGGSRQFVQIVSIDGKRVERGLGGYPRVSLQEARELAFDNRRAIRRGKNPFENRPKRRTLRGELDAAASTAPTFADAFAAYFEIQRPSWKPKTAADWQVSLETYAMPTIGKMPVDAITTADVEAILRPIWHEKHDTAAKLKQRIHAVLKWAVAHGHRESNPVDAVDALLGKVRKNREHRKALPYAEVPQAIATVRNGGRGSTSAKLALEFLILTAARSGEVRGATWSEIDWKAGTWTIPAERMKAKAEHVVPLPDEAFEVLNAAMEAHGDDGLIFPARRRKVLHDKVLIQILQDHGMDATVHGFRSSFRDWAAENGVERDVAEAALAHTLKNAVEAAYLRTDYLEKRRAVMEAWAKHCEPTKGQLAIANKRRGEREAA